MKRSQSVNRVRTKISAGVIKMRKNYHITKTGELKRKDNTLLFIPDTDDSSTHIPIKNVDAIYAHEEIRFNTKMFSLLDEHTIELHLFNWGSRYVGGYMPTKSTYAGETVVKQVESYQKNYKRTNIAGSIVQSSIHNMLRTIEYYREDSKIGVEISKLKDKKTSNLSEIDDIDQIMGREGEARDTYYSAINKIIPDIFSFKTRSYNPPDTSFNALISFCNSLLYGTVSSSIQSTALNPTISFLHEPSARRHSLALDIADIFKPVIVDRMILRLVNRNQIDPDDFDDNLMLNDEARKTVLAEYEDVLEETIEHPSLERSVSYQYLIKLDVLNLKKHILTGEEYSPFKRWW